MTLKPKEAFPTLKFYTLEDFMNKKSKYRKI